jgi:hypothetical protein
VRLRAIPCILEAFEFCTKKPLSVCS